MTLNKAIGKLQKPLSSLPFIISTDSSWAVQQNMFLIKGKSQTHTVPVKVFPPLYGRFRTASRTASLVPQAFKCHSIRGSPLYCARPTEPQINPSDNKVVLFQVYTLYVLGYQYLTNQLTASIFATILGKLHWLTTKSSTKLFWMTTPQLTFKAFPTNAN